MKLQAIEREINQELSQVLKTIPEAILLNEFYVLYFLIQSQGQSLTVRYLTWAFKLVWAFSNFQNAREI